MRFAQAMHLNGNEPALRLILAANAINLIQTNRDTS